MSKLKFGMIAAVSLMGGLLLGGLLYAQVNLFGNGDFETGTLSGWTQFTTANGTMGSGYPKVAPFDTNGDGIATMSAQFSVGQVTEGTKLWEGGGIYQLVDLAGGDYNISADIAAADEGSPWGNVQSGKFELLVDGVVVDTFDFGPISASSTKRSLLAALPGMGQGSHEIRIRITRPGTEAGALTQYLDNIVLSEIAAADPVSTDEPGASEDCDRDNRGGNKDANKGSGENSGGTDNKDGKKHCSK